MPSNRLIQEEATVAVPAGETKMIKNVGLFKRKPGMSQSDFVDYYETKHAPLALSLLPQIAEYRRNFVIPGSVAALGNGDFDHQNFDFDVMVETWVRDDDARAAMTRAMSDPIIARAIAGDEANLFDRGHMLMFAVDEHKSSRYRS